jgi:ubiquitin-protein ligase
MTVLERELTSLKMPLPPGISLKVSEARPDVMKVMIIGIDGSPYAGGLFM